MLNNLVLAFLGNLVGAGFFVAGFYWFLHLRGTEDPEVGRPADAYQDAAAAAPAAPIGAAAEDTRLLPRGAAPVLARRAAKGPVHRSTPGARLPR